MRVQMPQRPSKMMVNVDGALPRECGEGVPDETVGLTTINRFSLQARS
jgi:hypothetical protein